MTFGQEIRPIYLDKDQIQCDASEAAYIRYIVNRIDELYQIEDYWIDNRTLFQKGWIRIGSGMGENSIVYNLKRKDLRKLGDFNESGKLKGIEGRHIKHGNFERFYKNGNKQFSGNYVNDRKSGLFNYWYDNGNTKGDFVYSDSLKNAHEFQVLNFFDSLNQQLVKDGEGFYYEIYDEYKAEGAIKNGYRTGVWTGNFRKGKSTFVETFEEGELVEGKSIDSLGCVYTYSEILAQPEYQNGIMEFYKFIGSNMKYPKDARLKGIQGKVYVQFVVDMQGNKTDVKVIKGISPSCDLEALEVVEKADYFVPAKYRGQPAQRRMIIPITFSLSKTLFTK
ncbi:MAG: TonB family protein [Cyclobacteriaceae bacterium]|nr:TonB family protein [Cyclobacteriaceae bacterium]